MAMTARAESDEGEKSSWTDKIKLYGDLRYRFELFQEAAEDTRDRHRIRARFGIKANPFDSLDLNFRLASGNAADPTSTNQTLDGGFTNKALNIDLAYFDWHPSFVEGAHLIGGKQQVPFYKPVGNQILWDGDLTPEGLAIKVSGDVAESVNIFVNTAALFAEERVDANDTWLLGGQAGVKISFSDDKTYAVAGLGYFLYTDAQGKEPLAAVAGGNTLDANSLYSNDYATLELLGEAGTKTENYKFAVYGEFVTNTKVSANDKAYIGGLKVTRAFGKQSLSFHYNYRHIESDAVLGAYTDSDFAGGGTNGRGHKFNLGYKINKYAKLASAYYLNKTASSGGNNYHRFQLDAIFKFN